MDGPWIVMCDVDGVQSWLLRSVHLREIAGASQLLVDHDAGLATLADGGDVLFSGGGTAVVRFIDESAARAFASRVPEDLRRATVSATLTVSDPVPVGAGSFGDAIARAVRDVEVKKRGGQAVGEAADFCHALRCEGCGLEPAVAGGLVKIGTDRRWLGAACLARHEKRERVVWLEWMGGHDNWRSVGKAELPTDANELAGTGRLAVVLADVNGVGDRLAALDTEQKYQRFSKGLAAAVRGALVEAIASEVPPARWTGGKLPVEVLYAGGDDLLIACRGDLALPLVEKLVTEFTSRAGREVDWTDGEPLGISVGIAVVGAKFPFRVAHAIAAGLLRHAKREARAQGWIEGGVDWAVVTEAWAEADGILSDRAIESAGSSLHVTGRPYRASAHGVRSLGSFRRACDLVATDFPRNKLYDLRAWCSAGRLRTDSARVPSARHVDDARTELRDGVQQILRRLRRNPEVAAAWDRMAKELDLDGIFWNGASAWRTPLGDLAEGIDLWGLS